MCKAVPVALVVDLGLGAAVELLAEPEILRQPLHPKETTVGQLILSEPTSLMLLAEGVLVALD
jgi:hypothetical protein